MTVYLAIPPDRLRSSLGFVRGFIGLALDAMTAAAAPVDSLSGPGNAEAGGSRAALRDG